jgi:uncharacterized protein (DUF433 family)
MPNNDKQPEKVRGEVFRTWARGVSPEATASLFGLSLAEVKEIIRSQSERDERPSQADPERVFTEHRIRVDAVVEELAIIASKERGLIRVKAIEARFRALLHKWDLQQAVGIVPSDLGGWRARLDAHRVSAKLLEIFDEYELESEIRHDVVDALLGPERAHEMREDLGLA